MRLVLTDLERLAGVLSPVRTVIEQLAASIAVAWDQQHRNDGTHGVVTAELLTVAALAMGGTGEVLPSAIISPTIAADQNNYNPSGLSTAFAMRLTATGASRTVTGLKAPTQTGAVNGIFPIRLFLLINVGGQDVVLPHVSGSSAAANQFVNPFGATVTVRPGGSLWLMYDQSAWRTMGL